MLVSFSPRRQDCDLLVLDASWIGEAVHRQVGEMLCQHPCARFQPRLGYHKHQNSGSLQPAIRVFEKHQLQPLIVGSADFKVVGWVEVDEGQRIRRTAHLERIGMDCFDATNSGLFCPKGINFDAVAVSRKCIEQASKTRAIAHARIEGCKRFVRGKATLQSSRLTMGKWEKP